MCCGRRRVENFEAIALAATASVAFRYSGPRTLVVRGPVTGREYRFASGLRLLVHARDAVRLGGIPGLRQEGT